MKLSQLGEFGLINRIRRLAPKTRDVLLGIGDDAAWVKNNAGSCLITSDVLLEGIHFNLKWTSFYSLGYKTLAVNLSDIAAMGGRPAFLILSLGIPAQFTSENIEEFYRGIRSLASKSGVSLVGGDTNAARSFVISACVIGYPSRRPVTRGGARIGDDIYVTGTLGDSALALKLLQNHQTNGQSRVNAFLLSRHHYPTARLKAGALLAQERLARAMIDVSDGLLQDLGHICEASGVGATIWAEKLPLSPAYQARARGSGARYALTGGEDYELLFCVRRRDRARMEAIRSRLGVPVTRIGQCVPRRVGLKVLDRGGKPLLLRSRGHDHFKEHKLFASSQP